MSEPNSMDEEEFEFLEIEAEQEEEGVLGLGLGLSHWEFIDASDADSEKHHHSDSDQQQEEQEQEGDREGNEPDGFDGCASSLTDPIETHQHLLVRFRDVGLKPHLDYGIWHGHDDDDDDDDENEDEDEDEGEGDDVYGLDDELVPWSVSDKFGRQRLRKLGKRTFPKMHTSKRSPYLLVRPGCVRGKHGLGLKHIY